jgi:hypothetical protein
MPTSQPVTPVQLLRSQVLNKRPNPDQMLLGQPAVNINSAQPGLFFADETNATLIKIGPCAVGSTAPNAGATGAPGQLGNTLGELWLDLNTSAPYPGPVLKVWDGSQWINCFPAPSVYAIPIISDTEPTLLDHPDGTLWWNSDTGLMYILYNDGNTRQWTQVSSSVVS